MTRPLHVAQICLSSLGGSSVVAADLAQALVRAGHRSTLVSTQRPLRLERLDPAVQWCPVALGDHPALQQAGAQTVALAGALVQLALNEQVDVFHCHYAVPHAAAAWLARLTLGDRAPKLVVSLHGTDASAVAADPLYQPLLRAALLQADAVTAPSLHLAQLAQNTLQLPQVPQVIPNFVDTAWLSPAAPRHRQPWAELFPAQQPAEPVLLHLSNFRPVKRTLALVPLLAALQAHLPCRLVLVGDGPERPAFEQALVDAGLQDRCRVLAPRTDCRELLQHADVFLLPSATEGFGLAALEAMACATPVVASAVGGLPEVIRSGQTGLLVDPRDENAWVEAVLSVLTEPQRAARLGAAARAEVLARFGQAAGLERWLGVYAGIGAGNR